MQETYSLELTRKECSKTFTFALSVIRMICHGNRASKERHAASNHKNDPGFNLSKSIVPINHQAVVAAKRKKEDNILSESEDTEQVMEIENSSDNSSSRGKWKSRSSNNHPI
jgi:hypothetical protein